MITTIKPYFLFLIILFLFSCSKEEAPEPEKELPEPETEAELPANVLAQFENLNGNYFYNNEVWFWVTDANNVILDYAKKEGDVVSLQRPAGFTQERVTVHILTIMTSGEYALDTYHQIKPKRFVYPDAPQGFGPINLNFLNIPSSAKIFTVSLGGESNYSLSSRFSNSPTYQAYAQTDNVLFASWLQDDIPQYKLVEGLLPGNSYPIDLSQSTTSGIRPLTLSLGNQPQHLSTVHISASYTTASGNRRLLRAFLNSFSEVAAQRSTIAYLPEFLTQDYNLWVTAGDVSRPAYSWSNRYKSHYPTTINFLEAQFTIENKDPDMPSLQTAGNHDFAIMQFTTEYFDEYTGFFYSRWKIYGNKSFALAFPSLPEALKTSHPDLTPDFFKQPDSYYLAIAEEWSTIQGFDDYMSKIFGVTPFSPLLLPANESQKEVMVRGNVQ